MSVILTAAEMRAADADAAAAVGVDALIRNAGAAIAAFVRAAIEPGGRLVAFAGKGNNGADALAAFAILGEEYTCVIHALDELDDARRALEGADLAIDALLGTGARLPLSDAIRAATSALDRDAVRVLAVDLPTGVDADTGAVDPGAVRASDTLALGAYKPAHLLDPSRSYCGNVHLAPIGIDGATLTAHARSVAALDDSAFLALLPQRADDADKRSAGAPLIVAGSEQFPGAAVLCARGAARAGAGYVTLATPAAATPVLRTHLIEQVVVTLGTGSPEGAAADLLDIATHNGAVAIGPGLALDDWTGAMVRAFVDKLNLPFVLDASGLFHIGKHVELLRAKRCVVTPHAGEFARLSGKGTIAGGARVTRLREFVSRTGVTTLLKGHDTLIDDGTTVHINTTGTSALATAGSGDTLTGVIATLLAQGLSPVDAARTGAYWHGLAGAYCARRRGVGVVAGDLAEALGPATRRLRASSRGVPRHSFASSTR